MYRTSTDSDYRTSTGACNPASMRSALCDTCSMIQSKIQNKQFQVTTSCSNAFVLTAIEHHSKLGTDIFSSYLGTLWQAAYIGVDILRLILCYTSECNEYIAYYFPSNANEVKMGVTEISIKFEITKLTFECTCKQLSMDTVEKHCKSTIQRLHPIVQPLLSGIISVKDNMYLNTVVRLDHPTQKEVLLKEFKQQCAYFSKWKNMDMIQLESRSSFVFLVTSDSKQVFAKCTLFVGGLTTHAKHNILKTRMKAVTFPSPVYESTVDFTIFNKEFYIYPRLLGPLLRSEAKLCFHDFFVFTVIALKRLHLLGLAHRDVRLENICFSKKPSFRAVLIDIDSLCDDNETIEEYKDNSLKSCLYAEDFNHFQIDWRQLGCLAIWVLFDDVECIKRLDNIHSMDISYITNSLLDCDQSVWGTTIKSLIQGELCCVDY